MGKVTAWKVVDSEYIQPREIRHPDMRRNSSQIYRIHPEEKYRQKVIYGTRVRKPVRHVSRTFPVLLTNIKKYHPNKGKQFSRKPEALIELSPLSVPFGFSPH